MWDELVKRRKFWCVVGDFNAERKTFEKKRIIMLSGEPRK